MYNIAAEDVAVNSLPAFKYVALDEEAGLPEYFRVCRLHHERNSDTLAITLINTNRSQRHYSLASYHNGVSSVRAIRPRQWGFTAISYCWGSDARPHYLLAGQVVMGRYENTDNPLEIECPKPSGILHITQNLRDLLLMHRKPDCDMLLWVDALCINQDDNIEKAWQVSIMHNIYEIADFTAVYLSQSQQALYPGMLAAGVLAELLDKEPKDVPADLNLRNLASEVLEEWPEDWPDPWDLFFYILMEPWFQRVWIVQEIVFSEKIVFTVGPDNYFNWEVFIDGCRAVMKHLHLHPLEDMRWLVDRILRVEDRRTFESNLRHQHKSTIEANFNTLPNATKEMHLPLVLDWTRRCNATDPRDKVFALLNMCLPVRHFEEEMPKISYDMSVCELYARVARYSFLSCGQSQCLMFLESVDHSCDAEDLPSWVADWRRDWSSFPWKQVHTWGDSYRDVVFPDIPSPFKLPLHLRVRGLKLMTIKDVGMVTTSQDRISSRHTEFIGQLPHPYPTTNLSYREAFVKVIKSNITDTFELDDHRPLDYDYWDHALGSPVADNSSANTQVDMIRRLNIQNEAFDSQGLLHGRLLFISENGFIGLVPRISLPGDVVVFLFGGAAPFVLRKKRDDELGREIWTFLGQCFVLGSMGVEVMKNLDEAMKKHPELMFTEFILE